MRLLAIAVALLAPLTAAAQTPACDELSGKQRESAREILESEFLYACCDRSINDCLNVVPTCALSVRLADNVCRRTAAGQDEKTIRRALSRRARSMVGGGSEAEIDLTGAPAIGPEDSEVTLVVYACARCPYCSRLLPKLYEAIDGGPLEDRVRLVFRIFPIRGHEGSTESGLAFAAAHELGAFWPFMLDAYTDFEAASPAAHLERARRLGLDGDRFRALTAAPALRARLVASKKEGLVNEVEETPTFFMNGRRWVGDLEVSELVDAVLEESERLRGNTWVAR